MKVLGLLGGTFDPIHYGHLNLIENSQQAFGISDFNIIPCKTPVLKNKATANQQQRLAMIKLAINNNHMKIDERELHRETPSYTVLTLKSIREEVGENISLAFIMGMDSFNQIEQWRDWSALLDYAHIIIFPRPHYHLNASDFYTRHLAKNKNQLHLVAKGFIFSEPSTKLIDVSSSQIRENVNHPQQIARYLPDTVLNYINQHKLYQS